MADHYGMLDPDVMDPPDKPFSYFACPTDMLGAWGAPAGVEVTPEGYLWTGYGELMFFTGLLPVPVQARIRTLHRGYLPAIEYEVEQNGLCYAFRLFAADVGGALKGVPVSFATVTVSNTLASEPRAAYLSAGWRYRAPANTLCSAAGDYRFGQRKGSVPERLSEGLGAFSSSCLLSWSDDAVRRDGRMLFAFPTDSPPSRRSLALEDNNFHYHAWYGGGNTTEMSRAFEYMGLLDIARRAFLFFHSKQWPDGSFRLAGYEDRLYWEFFGYNLWGWGRHYQLTRDRGFLAQVYPGVVRAMAWHASVTAQDPFGLLPPATIADDAYLKNCRQTGQHIWVLIGLRHAVTMAREMGQTEDVARFEAQEQRFRAAFDRLLERQTAQTGGYIPPALERTTAGNDWDNLRTLHPEVLSDPMDPRVEATLRTVRDRYQEGVLAYTWPAGIGQQDQQFVFNEQPGLHYWQTPNNAQASLVRGTAWDQEWAVRELYAMLLHSTSTHLPAEFGTIPWSTRGYSHVFNHFLRTGDRELPAQKPRGCGHEIGRKESRICQR